MSRLEVRGAKQLLKCGRKKSLVTIAKKSTIFKIFQTIEEETDSKRRQRSWLLFGGRNKCRNTDLASG